MEYIVIVLFLTAAFQKGYFQAQPPEAEQEVAAFLPSNTPRRSSPNPPELDREAGRVKVTPLSPALKNAQQYLKWIQSGLHSGRQGTSPREEIRKSRMATFSNPEKLPVDPLGRGDLPPVYQIDMDPGIYPRDSQTTTGPAPDPIFNPTTQTRPTEDSIFNLPGQFPFNVNTKVTGLTLPGTIPGIYPAEPRDPAQFVHPAMTKTIDKPPPSFVKNVQKVKTDQKLHRLQNRQGQNRDMRQQLESKNTPFQQSRKLLVSRANRRPATATATATATTPKQTQYTGLRMNMLKVPQLAFMTNQNAQQKVKQRRRNVPLPGSKPDTEVQQLFGSGRDKIISFTRVNRKPTEFGNAKPKVTANLWAVSKQLQSRSNQIPNTITSRQTNSQPVRNVNAPKSKKLPNQRSFRFNQSSAKPVVSKTLPTTPMKFSTENRNPPKPNVILQSNQQTRPKVTTLPRSKEVRPLPRSQDVRPLLRSREEKPLPRSQDVKPLPRSQDIRPLPLIRIQRNNDNGRTSIRRPNQEDLPLLDQINEAKKRTRVLEQFKKQSNLMRGAMGVNQKNGDSLFNRRVQNIQNLATASAQEMKKALFVTQNRPPPKQTLESLARLRSQQQQKPKPKPQQEIGIRIRSQSRHQSQAREMEAQQQSQLQSSPPELPVIPERTKPAPPKVLSLSKSIDVSKLVAPKKPEIITVDNYRSSPQTVPPPVEKAAPSPPETSPQQTQPTQDDQRPQKPEETISRDFIEQYRLAEERQPNPPNLKDILNTYQSTLGTSEQFPSYDQGRENQHLLSSTSQQSTQGQNTVQIDESNLDELFRVYAPAAEAPKLPVIREPDPQSDSAVPFSDSQIQYLMGLLNSQSQKDPSTQYELQDPNSVPSERRQEPNRQRFEATRSFDEMQVVKLPNTFNDRAQQQLETAQSTAVSPELVKRLGDGLSSLAGSPVGPVPDAVEYQFVMPPGVATKPVVKPMSDFQVDQRSNTPDPTVNSLPAFQGRRNLAQDPVFSFPVPPTYDPQSLTKSLYGQTSLSTLEKQPSGPTSPEINPGVSPQGPQAAYVSSQMQQAPQTLTYHNNPFLRQTPSSEIRTPVQSTPQADSIPKNQIPTNAMSSSSSLSGDQIRIQSPSIISPASATAGLRNQFTAKSSSNDQLPYMVNPGPSFSPSQALRTSVKSPNGGFGQAPGNQAPIQMGPMADRVPDHLMTNPMVEQRHSMTNDPASSIRYQVPVQMIPISNQDVQMSSQINQGVPSDINQMTVQPGSNQMNGQTYSGINQAPAQISNHMTEELVRNQMLRQQMSNQLFNQQMLDQMSTQQVQSQTSGQQMFNEAAGQTSYMNNQGLPQVSGQVPPQMLSPNTPNPGQMPYFIDQPSEQVTYQTSSGINQMPTQLATHIHDIPGQYSTINNPSPVYSDINQMGGQMNMWSDQGPTPAMTGQLQDQAYLEMNLQPNQAYSDTNAAYPNTNQAYPDANQASPITNQGYPNTNQASPNTNQGYPNANQASPNTNQGFQNTNQGFQNTNQGYSDTNQGYPNTNQASPNTNQGYPDTNQAYSDTNQASPNTNQASPNTNQGYPDTNQGYPNTNQGYPDTNQAYSNTNQAYPNTNQGHSDPNQAYPDTNQALLEATVRQLAGQTQSQINNQGVNQMPSMRSVQNNPNSLSSQAPESHASDPGYTTEIRLVRVPISQLTQQGQINQNPQGGSLPRNNNDQMIRNGQNSQNPNYMVQVQPQIVNAASTGSSSSQPAIQEQPQSSHVVLTREQYLALHQAVTGNNNMGTTQNRGYA